MYFNHHRRSSKVSSTIKAKVKVEAKDKLFVTFLVLLLSVAIVNMMLHERYLNLTMDNTKRKDFQDVNQDEVDTTTASASTSASTSTSTSTNKALTRGPEGQQPGYQHRIPHRIIMSDRSNSIHDIEPLARRQNTFHTIYQYAKFWDEEIISMTVTPPSSTDDSINYDDFMPTIYRDYVTNANNQTNRLNEMIDKYLWYLNDETCLQILQAVEPKLVPYFQKEKSGKYRADICRVAALYQKGGYYFDTDMQVVQLMNLNPSTTFTSPFEANDSNNRPKKGLFNSFIASAPNHPILNYTLQSILGYYRKEIRLNGWMGPGTLYLGYKHFLQQQQELQNYWPIDMHIEEKNIDNRDLYPTFPRHVNGKGCCCDFVVHNFTSNIVYFYSRIVGSGDFCAAI